MPGGAKGRGRGRGGSNYKTVQRNESVHDRLGKMPVYPKINLKKDKYKFVRPTAITSSIVSLPAESRVKSLSRGFLRSYYDIFDQPGRPNLEKFYNTDAFFSFSSTYLMPPPTQFGRNLLEVREPELRLGGLIHEKTQIASTLAGFTATEHVVNHLTCDIPFYIANPMYVTSMHIIVSGVFKDASQTTNPLNAFSRVFILKQVSVDKNGDPVYEIFNDLFMLQQPTPDQIRKFHQDAQNSKRLSGNQDRSSNSQTSGDLSRAQNEMVNSIMVKTRMNRAGSKQLLQENNWDENKSLQVFSTLVANNKIPQEFFTH